MGWKYDTPERFKSLYGVKSADLQGQLRSARDKRTALGGELYRTIPGGYEFMPVSLGGLQLWAPVIRAVCRKTVVETPLVERDGSVKEIISTDDWIINIRGVIKRSDGEWPDAELEQLLDIYRRNEAVSIQSALTNRLLNGAEYVVITNLSLPERQGYTQSVEYQIECVADKPFELVIDE